MDIYKVSFEVDDRTIETTVKMGVLATVETGQHDDRVERPENRVSVMVNKGREQPTAWIQISKFDGEHFRLMSEGWVTEGGVLSETTTVRPLKQAAIQRASDDEIASLKTHEDSFFGRSRCCTSYGNGCYVKCCGGCCSDPYGCPGASCCP